MDSLKIKRRRDAKKDGETTYFTGKPCKNGQIYERYINGNCLCPACESERYEKYQGSKRVTELKRRGPKGNPKHYTVLNREWKKRNREYVYAMNMQRKADKLNATPKWFGEFDEFIVKEAHHLTKLREAKTGIKWSVDHMIPFKAVEACGLHCAANIQVIPEKLNLGKRHRMILTEPNEWIKAL